MVITIQECDEYLADNDDDSNGHDDDVENHNKDDLWMRGDVKDKREEIVITSLKNGVYFQDGW